MSVLNENQLLGSSGAGGGYNLTDSLRFRQSASAYLSRTPTTAGNRKTWTYSAWVKLGDMTPTRMLFLGGTADASSTRGSSVFIYPSTSGTAPYQLGVGSYGIGTNRSTMLFRDPSAWYHIVLSVDTTQATAADRTRLYVNGIENFFDTQYFAQNVDTGVNSTTQHEINANYGVGTGDGYITEVNFVDGQALTASDFGETDTDTGVWKPKKYTGTYGTNGFYLPMKQTTQAEGFNTVTYTGNGTNISVNRVGFQPDLIWVKNREQPDWHHLFDSVRGLGRLSSNDTANEYVDPPVQQLQSYNTDGFTYGTSSSGNASGEDYVAWCWEAGGTASSNTDGTITSSVSANTAKGFSVVTYTGNGSTGTVGHGLGSAPEMIIIKNRSQADGWYVWHQSNAAGIFGYLFLNSTDQVRSSTPQFGSTAPDSSVISLTYNTNDWANASGENYVAYCFSEVSGFSKFGTYTGNGTSQSINLGFRPAFVMWKRTDAAGNSWIIKDNTRYADNKGNLFPNATTVENTDTSVTFTDTGFDVDSALGYNGSGRVFIYMAFADTRDYQWNFDASGNKNNWTPNNINSNAPGDTTYDIMSDVPTLTNKDTANYAVLNPLGTNDNSTFSEANLKVTSGSGASTTGTTIGMTTGKWYAEYVCTAKTSVNMYVGLVEASTFDGDNQGDEGTNNGYIYINNGNISHGFASDAYGASWAIGDVIGIAFDADTRNVEFFKNNVGQGTYTRIASENSAGTTWLMTCGDGQASATATFVANFGQRPFAYTPPAGYKKLNTYNLPDSSIKDGSQYFNTVLYSGNGSTQSITGVGFQPDWLWLKSRSNAANHGLFDVLRVIGSAEAILQSNTTAAENTGGAYISSFDSDGFTVNANTSGNASGQTYVGWNWKANGSGVSNTDGTITSTVSANTTSGFSVVSWTGNGVAGATIGHGLGTAPSVVITKGRSYAQNWAVYHSALGATKWLQLNSSVAQLTETGIWNNTAPTSSVFTHGNSAAVNPNGGTNVSYCFAEVEGFSKFGSYTGNGSTDGPFVYTGFRPAFVLLKNATATSYWVIYDKERDSYNAATKQLFPNDSIAEYVVSNRAVDFVSNGFKLREAHDENLNNNGQTIIYMAFAENPFKNSLAR